jgi:hypothetical protein
MGQMKQECKFLVSKTEESNHFGDINANGRIILKWIARNYRNNVVH